MTDFSVNCYFSFLFIFLVRQPMVQRLQSHQSQKNYKIFTKTFDSKHNQLKNNKKIAIIKAVQKGGLSISYGFKMFSMMFLLNFCNEEPQSIILELFYLKNIKKIVGLIYLIKMQQNMISNSRQQTVDNRQQKVDSRQQTVDSRQQTVDSRQCIVYIVQCIV